MKQLGKNLGLLGIVIFTIMFLVSCTPPYNPNNQVNHDLLNETWMQQMQVDPKQWTAKAGRWFFTGEPDQITHYAIHTRVDSAMTDVTVRVPDFTQIVINGNFQVQLMGDQEHNSVSILGANVDVREVAVDVNNNTLYIHQTPNPKTRCDTIVVRIGINNLRRLVQNGNGTVAGRTITSDNLSIKATGGGTIILNGNMNVTKVFAGDNSTVSILGAYAPCVKVRAVGRGSINIAGRVGIQSITNLGNGSVTIVGADSNTLKINTDGHGITRVIGIVNLRNVFARGFSRVYVYCVMSKKLVVKECDHACVGVSGNVDTLSVELYDYAGFWGKTLCSNFAYAQVCNWSHANISARQRFFATARGYSSIYFFGTPSVVSRFTSDKAVILPMWSNDIATPPFPYHELTTSSFKGQNTSTATTAAYGNY